MGELSWIEMTIPRIMKSWTPTFGTPAASLLLLLSRTLEWHLRVPTFQSAVHLLPIQLDKCPLRHPAFTILRLPAPDRHQISPVLDWILAHFDHLHPSSYRFMSSRLLSIARSGTALSPVTEVIGLWSSHTSFLLRPEVSAQIKSFGTMQP